MRQNNNFNGSQMRTLIALVCGLFISSVHAETMPADTTAASAVGAASSVAATPATGEAAASAVGAASSVAATSETTASAVGAASSVAATPEAAAPETPAVALSPLEEQLELCAGCHNPDGNSVIPENPKLSGLDKKYIRLQLEDFKSGARKNETMGAIIQGVDEGMFDDLAEFFSNQKRSVNVSDNPELVAQGQQIFEEGVFATAAPACMGCHGEDGSGSKKFPRLNGQNAPYVVNQLTNFANGARTNDAKGLMQAVSKRLSEKDIAAVAEYMSTLKEIE